MSMRLFGKQMTVQDLVANYTTVSDAMLQKARPFMSIVVIDNDAQCRIDESLIGCGYTKTARKYNIERIADIEPYQIVLLDIKGVGAKCLEGSKSAILEGLAVAKEIKRQYPTKSVLAFSALLDDYKDHYILRSLDGYFQKEEAIGIRNEIIDQCLVNQLNPICKWKIVRRSLLDADVRIDEVARLESYFVSSILGKQEMDEQRAVKFVKNAGLALGLIKDLVSLALMFKTVGG